MSGSASPRAHEIALAVIEVQPGSQRVFVAPEFVAPAHHEQVLVAVAIRVEEDRVDVLREAVRRD